SRGGRRDRVGLRAARQVRDRPAPPALLPDELGQRGRAARTPRGAVAALAQPGAPPGGPRRAADARRPLARALAAPLLACPPARRLGRVMDLAAKIRDIPDFPRPG